MWKRLLWLFWLLSGSICHGFVVATTTTTTPSCPRSYLCLVEDNNESDGAETETAAVVVDDRDNTTGSTTDLYRQLESRQRDLKEGIGKRYICRTQKGFLNVHQEPSHPYDLSNIVGQLWEGQIVTSLAPSSSHQDGSWIRHDHGGWSIRVFGGFVWLEPLNE